MMEWTTMQELAAKFRAGTADPEEKARLHEWFDRQQPIGNDPEDQHVVLFFPERTTKEQLGNEMLAAIKKMIAADRLPADSPVYRIPFFTAAWFRYAAVLLLIAGVATFLYKAYQQPPKEIVQTRPADILPGTDRAILTLSGGEQIQLDSGANAALARHGISNRNAVISYLNAPATAINNILTTPRGGQYKLQLPDGTLVWLNAASSITYPTAFTEDTRKVTLRGEAYFEVAANKDQPFIVQTPTDEIRVLGTSFNVNAYADEDAVKTSLLAGSVQIAHTILKPGQAYSNGTVTATNTAQDVAWKNGAFAFHDTELPAVMRQLARWYRIDVRYEGALPAKRLEGKIGRDLSLQQCLKLLESMHIHFRLEGSTLTVIP